MKKWEIVTVFEPQRNYKYMCVFKIFSTFDAFTNANMIKNQKEHFYSYFS